MHNVAYKHKNKLNNTMKILSKYIKHKHLQKGEPKQNTVANATLRDTPHRKNKTFIHIFISFPRKP